MVMAYTGPEPVKPELSDSEQSTFPARAMFSSQGNRKGCWTSYKLALVCMALCLLTLEITTLGVAHWKNIRNELALLESMNAALVRNLSDTRKAEQQSEERLAEAQSEMRLRAAHSGEMQTELGMLQAENGMLRNNVSQLLAKQVVADKELQLRQEQWEAMAVKNMVLKDTNSKLRANLTLLQEQRRFLQADLDKHYKQFLDLRAAMERLELQNTELQQNLSDRSHAVAGLIDYAANQSRASALLRRRYEEVREENAAQVTRGALEKKELSDRYKQFVGMSEALELLRERNAELELTFLRLKEHDLAQRRQDGELAESREESKNLQE